MSSTTTPPDRTLVDPGALPFERLFIGFFFLFPILLFIYPALPHFTKAVAGLSHDNVLNLWSFWHASNAFMLQDEPLYSTLRILAPLGSSLALNDMCILPSFLLSPITRIFGVFAGFNSLLILSQFWAGFGTFCLVRYLTKSRLSAAFAAFLLELSPLLFYRMLDHYSLTYMGFIPFLTYLLLKGTDKQTPEDTRRYGIFIGASSVACFLTSFNIFLFSFFTLAFLWMALCITALRNHAYERIRHLMTILFWTGLICSGCLYLWAVVSPVQEARWGDAEQWVKTGNASRILLPYLLVPHPELWGFSRLITQWPTITGDANPENFCYLGWVALFLFAWGTIALWRHNRSLSVAFILFIALCLDLALGYGSVNINLTATPDSEAHPFLLFPKFLKLPFMKQARVPARWIFSRLHAIYCCCRLRHACVAGKIKSSPSQDRSPGCHDRSCLIGIRPYPRSNREFCSAFSLSGNRRGGSLYRNACGIPAVHGLWFERGTRRVLGYCTHGLEHATPVPHPQRLFSSHFHLAHGHRDEPAFFTRPMDYAGERFLSNRHNTNRPGHSAPVDTRKRCPICCIGQTRGH